MNGCKSIDELIAYLSEMPSNERVTNPYDRHDPFAAVRRENLRIYLGEHQRIGTQVVLLGEAPGYQGCRLTGIPFTSEAIMLRGVPELDLLGSEKGYQKSDEFERVHNEPSATIVWQTLARFRFRPLLWAAFPLHPHQPGNAWSNRAPLRAEVASGRPVFLAVAALLNISQIVPIGNVAHRSLVEAGITAEKIRHPAQGGKNEFVAGIERLVQDDMFRTMLTAG